MRLIILLSFALQFCMHIFQIELLYAISISDFTFWHVYMICKSFMNIYIFYISKALGTQKIAHS